MKRRKALSLLGWTAATGGLAIACSPSSRTSDASQSSARSAGAASPENELVIYSGRDEKLVGELIKTFESQTGAKVQVRYGDTAELAAAILEEQQNSPADVFFAQDAGALGALQKSNRTTPLSDALLKQVDDRYRSTAGQWVGVTGRMRTIDYNTTLVQPQDLPSSIFDLTQPQWKDKIGWAPTNASFQSFVTALRVAAGEEKAKQWLEGMIANNPKVYPKNAAIVEALSRGEIAIGLVNHYYLERFKQENPNAPVAHHYTNDVGSLVNVAGVAILNTARHPQLAEKFVTFLLSEDAQQYFSTKTYEYPLVAGTAVASSNLKALDQIKNPSTDLSNLSDLDTTLKLLQSTG
ncbi:MAG TPA: iron ABC transporter substrate-binding protein, partial [Coleofasciculaceae cyanobacterium]